MATTISNTDSRTIRNVRVKANFERTAFMFMRSSGIILVILAVGHDAATDLFNNVHYLSVEFVAEQWSSWGLEVYAWPARFALTHGINGFRNVLEDYHSQSRRDESYQHFIGHLPRCQHRLGRLCNRFRRSGCDGCRRTRPIIKRVLQWQTPPYTLLTQSSSAQAAQA